MLVTNFWLKYSLYRIVLGVRQLLDVGQLHPLRERSIRALHDSVDYIDAHMPNAIGFETQHDLLVYSIRQMPERGAVLEFGVYKGGTIRVIAKHLRSRTIDGFDSFEGLPDDWAGFSLDTESFNLKGKLPKVPANVRLHAGWFDKTLPTWLSANPGPIAMMHIDCDVYSSTKTIFEMAGPRLIAGSLVVFDEYFNYPGWQLHEVKAFKEWIEVSGAEYEYVAYARQQVTVRITKAASNA